MFSASVWASSIPVESTGKEKEKEKEKLLESVSLEMQSIRFGLFLFSVCHVILVVQDTPHDPNLWRYVRNLELLKHAIPDPGRPNATDQIPFPTPTDPHNTLLFGDRRVEFLPQIGSPLFFPPLFHFFLILIQMDLFSSSFSSVCGQQGPSRFLPAKCLPQHHLTAPNSLQGLTSPDERARSNAREPHHFQHRVHHPPPPSLPAAPRGAKHPKACRHHRRSQPRRSVPLRLHS